MPQRVEELDRRYAFRKLGLFDAEVQSYVHGSCKVSVQLSNKLLEAAHCTECPEALLLVDDRPEDLVVARSVGISALVYEHENTRKLVRQLCTLGILDETTAQGLGDIKARLQ